MQALHRGNLTLITVSSVKTPPSVKCDRLVILFLKMEILITKLI